MNTYSHTNVNRLQIFYPLELVQFEKIGSDLYSPCCNCCSNEHLLLAAPIHTHSQPHSYIHSHNTCAHILTHLCTQRHTHVHKCIHLHTHMHTHTHTHAHLPHIHTGMHVLIDSFSNIFLNDIQLLYLWPAFIDLLYTCTSQC